MRKRPRLESDADSEDVNEGYSDEEYPADDIYQESNAPYSPYQSQYMSP